MKKLVIILFAILANIAKTDKPLEQRAKNIAEEYYSSFQQLAQISDSYDEQGVELVLNIRKLAGVDRNGKNIDVILPISNDIDPVIGSNNSKKSDKLYYKYATSFLDYATEKSFGFSYKVISSVQAETPQKGVNVDIGFVNVLVRKTYSIQNKSVDVDETMQITFLKNRCYISSIMNPFGTAQTSGDMFALALRYYTNKQYKEALKTFEDCVKKHNNNAAKYYAAIMYLQNQGCKGMKRKERDEKAINYLLDLKRQWDEAFQTSLNTGNIENGAIEIETDEELLFPYKAVSLLGILGVY